jgi:hypothetical protein
MSATKSATWPCRLKLPTSLRRLRLRKATSARPGGFRRRQRVYCVKATRASDYWRTSRRTDFAPFRILTIKGLAEFGLPDVTSRSFRRRAKSGGKGIRTPGLLIANETLYQLSYTPI